MLGWATVEDVIDQYGEPSDRYENYNVTYELEGAEYTKHLDLTFYNGWCGIKKVDSLFSRIS